MRDIYILKNFLMKFQQLPDKMHQLSLTLIY